MYIIGGPSAGVGVQAGVWVNMATSIKIKAWAGIRVRIQKMVSIGLRILLPLVGAPRASLANLFLLVRERLQLVQSPAI